MLWVLSFHIMFMVTWFAGLFYLPRLYVYHAMSTDQTSIDRFKIMERKLYYGIMMPGALLTTLLGFWLITFNPQFYMQAGWLHAKITLVVLLWLFHLYCGHIRKVFYRNQNKHSHVFYRILNEIPVIFLIAIVILVVVKPF